MTPKQWMMLIALSVLWGGSFLFQGIAIKELPALTIVASRVILATVILIPALLVLGIRLPLSGPVVRAFVMMGLLNNVIPFTLIVWGQKEIASGLASILNAMTPIMTVIAAHLLTTDEKITPGKALGVALGFLGVGVMIGLSAFDDLGGDVVAQLAVIAATISYALASIYGRRFKQFGIAPLATAAGQVTASSVILVPMALLVEPPWNLPEPSGETILALLALGILSTALAYALFFRILAAAGATNVSLVTFLVPVSAIVLGIGVLDEVLAARHLIGMVLIALGLVAVDGRALRWIKRRN